MTDSNNAVEQALARLKKGNERFVAGLRSIEPLASARRIAELAEKGQAPFASVLGCADSRVPAELVFDCGLGDLFVCRVAGNIATPWMIASFEFAALKLKTPLVLIMGHTSCGALDAALSGPGPTGSKNLDVLVSSVKAPVAAARKERPRASRDELLLAAAWQNVASQRQAILKQSPILRELHQEGKLGIVTAVYHLRTGTVEFKDAVERAERPLAVSGSRKR